MDNELMNLHGKLVLSGIERQDRIRAEEKADRDFKNRALLGEEHAKDMPGFDAGRDPKLSPVRAHSGEAHYYINGFAGMPIKFINPRKSGQKALDAFKAGVQKRRELGA